MTPVISRATDAFSRLTVSWLEDINYEVNYEAADPFDGSMIGDECNCNRRKLRSTTHMNETDFRSPNQAKPRKLSTAGYETAVAYGEKVLEQRAANAVGMAPGLTENVVNYVGDQFIWVYYFEEGNIHDVLVMK